MFQKIYFRSIKSSCLHTKICLVSPCISLSLTKVFTFRGRSSRHNCQLPLFFKITSLCMHMTWRDSVSRSTSSILGRKLRDVLSWQDFLNDGRKADINNIAIVHFLCAVNNAKCMSSTYFKN
jgi:hypothetical protein